MKAITTAVCTINIPDDFEIINQSKIGVSAENRKQKCKVQHPHLEIRLFKIDDLDSDDYKGTTLLDKWEDWCISLNYKAEKISVSETEFTGFKTLIVHAHTDAAWNDMYFKLQYFHAAVFLDEDYFLEFKTVHEKIPSNTLDAWVLPVFESIDIKGDTKLRKQVWVQHLADMEEEERKYQEALKRNTQNKEEDKKKEFSEVQIPQNGEEFFITDEFDFEFVADECLVRIAELSKELLVTLKAKTKTTQVSKGIKNKLLSDYPGDGLVTLTIPAKGIHVDGVPTGQLYFEEEKTNAPLFLNARSEGFDYSLAFCGSVTFDSGWVLLKGEMTKSYTENAFPVHIAKKFDITGLQWNNYRFTSMEETQTANPEDVCLLHITNPDFTKLPEAIFTFENLEYLTIQNRSNIWEEKLLPLNEIQEELGQLKKLKTIYINGAAIEKLPESIGGLKSLEQLSINNCALKEIPGDIWRLPKLKYLWLSSNQLKEIPIEINLPELESISLDKNLFHTLPESLATQPKLNKIVIKGNPLEELPDAFNQVKSVELEMEDKLRLLDFRYKGADGSGLVDWNDKVFWSCNDADLTPEIEAVIAQNELEPHAKALLSLVKKSIGFKHEGEEDYREIGNHRFGGMPDLPKNMAYPRFGENWREGKTDYVYEFLGQINCSEITHLQEYLPRTGMLFFFLETMHNIYGGHNKPAKVLYCPENDKLTSGKRFSFTEEDYFEMYGSGYTPYTVSARKMNSSPSFYASNVNVHLFSKDAKSLVENEKLLEDLYDSFEAPLHENSDFEYAVNAYGFTQREAPELQASLVKKGNPEDWMTLLTVTSAGDMQWGDAGDLFFVIHKSDLAKGDFSNVFVTIESS